MAKLSTMGDSIQLKSAITMDEFKSIRRYKPEALTLVNEAKEPYFTVTVGDASASKYGVAFANTDDQGCLFLTMMNPVSDHSDRVAERQLLIDKFALIMCNLKEVEANVKAAMEETKGIAESVEDSIEML